MKYKKVLALFLATAVGSSMVACGNGSTDKSSTAKDGDSNAAEVTTAKEEDLGYTYGEGVTFKSDEPVTYSMMYSDHENYPYSKDWLLWSNIQEMSNVSLDLNIIARADYDTKKSLLINAGQGSYIIPKTYDESAFVSGGAVVPISDYTKYMPNYTAFAEEYNFADDLKTITKENGKYYRLPGMNQQPKAEYSWVIRKDIFDAAGVDITKLEKDYTWDTFSEALQQVADANPGKTVWSDAWKGDSLLSTIGNSYDVPAGWAKGDGTWYDTEKDNFYFANTTDDCKSFCTMMNNLVENKLLDPETFTQEDDVAKQKFYTGQSFMIGTNESMLGIYKAEMDKTLGAGKYELYTIVPPMGGNGKNYQNTNSRLENGIMISTKALEDLGEKDFIKMLRFVDWLWYSSDAQTFTKWGVEGKTYTVADGVKTLNSDISCGALNVGAAKALNKDFGFSNGVFAYGGTTENRTSMLNEDLQDYYKRLNEYRTISPLSPTVAFNEEETESMNLIKTPLVDYVNTTMLQFITGQKDINSGWDEYVKTCEQNNSTKYVEMCNTAYERNKK